MENFEKELLKVLECMPDTGKRTTIEEFIHVFYNRRGCSNSAILLGIEDPVWIKDSIGIDADEIFNDSKDYLCRIKKVARQNQEKVVISFNKFDSEISFDEKALFKELFEFYGNSSRVNLNLAFKNRSIPDLVVEDNVNGFLNNRHKSVVSLSGRGLISAITVYSSIHGAGTIMSSIDDMIVIPKAYKLLAVDSAEYSNSADRKEISGFWDKFVQKEIDNCYGFNFVILNNINDHLFRIFRDLVKMYKTHFSISDSDFNILRRIFFVSNENYFSNSRAFEEDSVILESLCRFKTSPEVLSYDIRDAELYSVTLGMIEDHTMLNYLNWLSDFDKAYSCGILELKKGMSKLSDAAVSCIDSFKSKYEGLDKTVKDISSGIIQRAGDRQHSSGRLGKAYADMLDFAEHYCTEAVADLVAEKENFGSSISPYLEAKKLGFSRYVKSEKDYSNYFNGHAKRISDFWKDVFPSHLSFDVWNDEADARIKLDGIVKSLKNDAMNNGSLGAGMFLFGDFANSLGKEVSSMFDSLEQTYESISVDGIISGEVEKQLNKASDKWNSVSSKCDSNPSSGSDRYLKMVSANDKMRKMLLSKINLILGS